ncbi:hypothetical protein P13BB106kb_p009 [Pectobacterium phage DU_PP_V]|uniref:Uncharacterized protein n=1 Tax=Pectobacterium phage DU_PP_V TaxID=2041492 RepID=A0A2D2W6Z6_9CAUD|nr:hypothetical protein HOS40_gp009 [Pectobacterium phage DU_PP_V]ATS93993.1 hypothetical protein P13BB106kb_p009 [Pectobacterium phage DU_PP_V]
MSGHITIMQTRTEVNVFLVPDTDENRALCEVGQYDTLIYDDDGYSINLCENFTENEVITHV